jgi:16S rRNA processing protein RimM
LEYITVGKLNKSFGTKGQIRVDADSAFKSDLIKSDVWFVEKSGTVIPYFVESLDDNAHFLVKFEDIDAPELAKKITGSILKLRKSDISIKDHIEENELDKLLGFSIQSKSGDTVGKIQSIEEYPQQLMAIVTDDAERRFLIPLASEFMIDLDIEKSILIMSLPEGLIESQF